MAAKQGLTAQLSQAGEDAKRAVLSRTVGTSHNWFSNLNTVCTIKSAPPKTPEVLELLATKSGWLFKRNEQHVWQARWCCVVPHMFLYYFDAHNISTDRSGGGSGDAATMGGVGTGGTIVSGSGWPPPTLPPPTATQQDEWNAAIRRDGLFKQHEKRGGFSLFQSSHASVPEETTDSGDHHYPSHHHAPMQDNSLNNGAEASNAAATEASSSKYTSSSSTALPQPAGIIDLECYTTVHRSRFSPNVLELAGDDQVNPDLRAFYFHASNASETDEWTDALLNGRNGALLDEVDAYKQVCDGFASQLQQLHAQVDTLSAKNETSQQQVYHLRSKREDERRKSWKFVQEVLLECQQKHKEYNNKKSGVDGDGTCGSSGSVSGGTSTTTQQQQPLRSLQSIRDEFLSALEEQQQTCIDKDAIPFVCEFAVALHETALGLLSSQEHLQEQLASMGASDQARVQELERRLAQLERTYSDEKKEWTDRNDSLKVDYQTSQKELQDVQKELSHSKMQMTMYSSQQKNKTNLLNEHKRILKKEVIDLRQKLEEANSQVSSLQHVTDSSKLQLEQERQKAKLLERYVEKVESQVTVQQNMMEMMSHSASVYGAGSGSVYGGGIPTGIAVNNSNGNDNSKANTGPTASATVSSPGGVSGGGVAAGAQQQSSHAPTYESAHTEDDDADVLVPMPDYHHHHQQPQQQRGRQQLSRRNVPLIDAMDDNKSHMSELTEDRTQRHFEAAFLTFNQHQPMVPNTSTPSPRVLMTRKQFESPRYGAGGQPSRPPSIILGETPADNGIAFDDTNDDDNNNTSREQLLDTIHSSAVSLPAGPVTPRFVSQKQEQQHRQQQSEMFLPRTSGDAVTVSDMQHFSHSQFQQHQQQRSGGSANTTPSKLSVAQRARLEADRGSTPVRVRLQDERVQASLQKVAAMRSSSSVATAPATTGRVNMNTTNNNFDSPNNMSSGASQSSGLWRRMEEAVLGPRRGDGYSDTDYSDDDDSVNSTRVTDYTEDTTTDINNTYNDDFVMKSRQRLLRQQPPPQQQQQQTPQQQRSRNRNVHPPPRKRGDGGNDAAMSEEKKVPEQMSPNLSLQERSQLLRAQQLRFLKEQGLIKDEQDVRGGAGASPGQHQSDTASVTSTNVSFSRSAVSFPGARTSSTRGDSHR